MSIKLIPSMQRSNKLRMPLFQSWAKKFLLLMYSTSAGKLIKRRKIKLNLLVVTVQTFRAKDVPKICTLIGRTVVFTMSRLIQIFVSYSQGILYQLILVLKLSKERCSILLVIPWSTVWSVVCLKCIQILDK